MEYQCRKERLYIRETCVRESQFNLFRTNWGSKVYAGEIFTLILHRLTQTEMRATYIYIYMRRWAPLDMYNVIYIRISHRNSFVWCRKNIFFNNCKKKFNFQQTFYFYPAFPYLKNTLVSIYKKKLVSQARKKLFRSIEIADTHPYVSRRRRPTRSKHGATAFCPERIIKITNQLKISAEVEWWIIAPI